MKIFLTIIAIFVSVYLTGCSNSDVTGPGGGLGGPGGPGGTTVSFTMQGAGNNQSYEFQFKPSVDVKLNYIIASLPAFGFRDSIPNGTPATVFTTTQFYNWYPYTGVESGQQWTFTFNGTINSDNQAFTSSVNFTTP